MDPNIIYGGDLETENYASFGDLLVKSFKKGGDQIALINAGTNHVWTFKQLHQESVKIAKALHGAGIKRNDIIGILCENRHENVAISYGTIYLNAVLAPANFGYTASK